MSAGTRGTQSVAIDDDRTIPIFASANLILDATRHVVSFVVRTFTLHGMCVFLDKHKMRVMFYIYGGGSQSVHDVGDGLDFVLPNGSKGSVSVTDRYKHLGSYVAVSETLMYDAQHRCSAALTAHVPIATRIFGSHFIGP